MKLTKTQLLNSPELNHAAAVITNRFADAFEHRTDKSQVDVSKLAEQVYNDNLTSTLSELIQLNKDFSKEEIAYYLRHMSEWLCSMGLMLAKASELEY